MNKTDYIILKSLAAWGKLLPIVLTVGICLSCADLTIRDEEEGRHPQPSAAFAGLCAENTSGQRIVKTLTLGESATSFESAFYLRSNLPFEKTALYGSISREKISSGNIPKRQRLNTNFFLRPSTNSNSAIR